MCQTLLVHSVSEFSEMSSSIIYSCEKVIQATKLKENTKGDSIIRTDRGAKNCHALKKIECCLKYKACLSFMTEICAAQHS